jgi:DNA-binding PadR family transcriptional regulator
VSRRRVNNPLALAVLGCLTERPMHPYEISTTLRTRGTESSIKLNYGSLYSVVNSLQKHGLIKSRETTREGRRPERTVYEITEAGTAEFEDWLAELLSSPTEEFTSLEAGLSLMPGLPPDEVARLLEDRSSRLEIALNSMDATRELMIERGLPELFLIEDKYRYAMTRAELEFVRTLARDIRTGALNGTKMWRRMYELREQGVSTEELLADPVGYLGEEGQPLQPPEQK